MYQTFILDRLKFAKSLNNAREMANISQSGAAETLGITQTAISRFESAQKVPSLEIAKRMAVLYGVKLDELLE